MNKRTMCMEEISLEWHSHLEFNVSINKNRWIRMIILGCVNVCCRAEKTNGKGHQKHLPQMLRLFWLNQLGHAEVEQKIIAGQTTLWEKNNLNVWDTYRCMNGIHLSSLVFVGMRWGPQKIDLKAGWKTKLFWLMRHVVCHSGKWAPSSVIYFP